MVTPAYHTYTASALLAGLREGSWSSETLTAYFLERIAEHNPSLHAVHALNPQALAQARELDKKRQQGEALGPLAGLPMTLKDAFACLDMPTSYGMWLYAWKKRGWDCQLVAALRQAGVVFLGHSAAPTGSFDWNCVNQIYPACVNPHDPERIPGGSSGGAAAALAAGLTPLELGSDAAGSIRYPAHCCGVYGLRTSDGWLPTHDLGPAHNRGFRNIAVAGPMANTLDDLQLLTQVLASAFPDSRLKPAHPPEGILRVAYCTGLSDWPPDPETQALMQQWLKTLNPEGVELIEAAPELPLNALNADWAAIMGYEMAHTLPATLPSTLKQTALDQLLFKKLGPGWLRQGMCKGIGLSKAEYLAALARCRSFQNSIDSFFKAVDLWVLPVSASAALKHTDCGKIFQSHLGDVSYSDYISSYLCATALMGTPSLSVPIGKTTAGLPIGLQVHGPRFGDLRLLAQLARLQTNAFASPTNPEP